MQKIIPSAQSDHVQILYEEMIESIETIQQLIDIIPSFPSNFRKQTILFDLIERRLVNVTYMKNSFTRETHLKIDSRLSKRYEDKILRLEQLLQSLSIEIQVLKQKQTQKKQKQHQQPQKEHPSNNNDLVFEDDIVVYNKDDNNGCNNGYNNGYSSNNVIKSFSTGKDMYHRQLEKTTQQQQQQQQLTKYNAADDINTTIMTYEETIFENGPTMLISLDDDDEEKMHYYQQNGEHHLIKNNIINHKLTNNQKQQNGIRNNATDNFILCLAIINCLLLIGAIVYCIIKFGDSLKQFFPWW